MGRCPTRLSASLPRTTRCHTEHKGQWPAGYEHNILVVSRNGRQDAPPNACAAFA